MHGHVNRDHIEAICFSQWVLYALAMQSRVYLDPACDITTVEYSWFSSQAFKDHPKTVIRRSTDQPPLAPFLSNLVHCPVIPKPLDSPTDFCVPVQHAFTILRTYDPVISSNIFLLPHALTILYARTQFTPRQFQRCVTRVYEQTLLKMQTLTTQLAQLKKHRRYNKLVLVPHIPAEDSHGVIWVCVLGSPSDKDPSNHIQLANIVLRNMEFVWVNQEDAERINDNWPTVLSSLFAQALICMEYLHLTTPSTRGKYLEYVGEPEAIKRYMIAMEKLATYETSSTVPLHTLAPITGTLTPRAAVGVMLLHGHKSLAEIYGTRNFNTSRTLYRYCLLSAFGLSPVIRYYNISFAPGSIPITLVYNSFIQTAGPYPCILHDKTYRYEDEDVDNDKRILSDGFTTNINIFYGSGAWKSEETESKGVVTSQQLISAMKDTLLLTHQLVHDMEDTKMGMLEYVLDGRDGQVQRLCASDTMSRVSIVVPVPFETDLSAAINWTLARMCEEAWLQHSTTNITRNSKYTRQNRLFE